MNNILNNIVLLQIVVIYIIQLFFVYRNYYNNNSISSIICNNKNNFVIKRNMLIMSVLIIIYEIIRNDYISLFIIISLLYGIWGILYTKEYTIGHNCYSVITFSSINVFMLYMSMLYNIFILRTQFILQLLFSLGCVTMYNKTFFFMEVLSITNFSLFYIIIHFI